MNNSPIKAQTPVKADAKNKSPHKSSGKKYSPHKLFGKKRPPHKFSGLKSTAYKATVKMESPLKHQKLHILRNFRDLLSNQKLELENDSFIEKVNNFQILLYNVVQKTTHYNVIAKKKITLLPLPDNKTDANLPAEDKLIAQIEQLQAEIYFLRSNQLPEEINKEYDFFITTANELRKLGVSADEKNNILSDLKKEQERLIQEEADRFRKEALYKQSKKAEGLTSTDQMPKRPVLLFNVSDLQKKLAPSKKTTEVVKQGLLQEKADHKTLIEESGSKSSLLRQYNGYMDIPSDTQLRSAIDLILDGKDINIALEDPTLSVAVLAVFKQHQENRHKKVVTPNKTATKAIGISTKLAECSASLEKLGIVFESGPNEVIIEKMVYHLLEQTKIIKEDTMYRQKQINDVLSKLEEEIETEKENLLKIKNSLSRQRLAVAKAEGLPSSSAELTSELSVVKTELAAKFAAEIIAMKTELKAQLSAALETPVTEAGSDKQQLSTVSTPKPLTLAFSASQSKTTSNLSTVTTDFLQAHEFICTNSGDLDKCTSKNKQFTRHTPLTLATLQINEAVCRSLLGDGADVNAKNGVGNTPLHMLCHAASTKGASIDSVLRLADMFLSNDGDLTTKNKENKNPIDIAINPSLATKFKQFLSQSKPGLVV